MFNKDLIVHNLNDTKCFTKTRISELTGISLNDVHQILKTVPEEPNSIEVFSDPDCIHMYCSRPNFCKESGCGHKRNNS